MAISKWLGAAIILVAFIFAGRAANAEQVVMVDAATQSHIAANLFSTQR